MSGDTLTARVEGRNLVVTVPLYDEPTPSSSEKTLLVGSSRGPKRTEAVVDGKPVYIVLSAYVYPKPKESRRG